MSRRSRTLFYGGAAALVAAGAVTGALLGGSVGGVAAIMLVGGGLLGLVALVFMEVGLSEDRQLERDRRRRERAQRARTGHSEQAGSAAGRRRTPFRPRRPP
jgi:hypothetical protein